jgi:hypothetical protein
LMNISIMGRQRVWIFPIGYWRDPLRYFFENPMVMLFAIASGVVILNSWRFNCVEVENWKTWCQNQFSFTSWHWPIGLEHGNLRLHFHGRVSPFCARFWKVMNCTQDFLSFVMTTFHWPITLKNLNLNNFQEYNWAKAMQYKGGENNWTSCMQFCFWAQLCQKVWHSFLKTKYPIASSLVTKKLVTSDFFWGQGVTTFMYTSYNFKSSLK